MAERNFWEYVDDFFGTRVFSVTQADDENWRIDFVGTPDTQALVTPSSSGEVELLLKVTTEAESVNLYQSDILQFDIDKIKEVHYRVKMSQAAIDATTMVAFGIASARNDVIETIAAHAFFRILGSADTTAIIINTDDDDSNDINAIATGQVLTTVYKDFVISFAEGTDDVRFFIDGQPVATAQTFDMSGYTGSFQLYMQIQKTSDNHTDGMRIDRVSINGVR